MSIIQQLNNYLYLSPHNLYVYKIQVHYQRSVKRVSERTNKVGSLGCRAFQHIGYEIPRAKSKEDVENLFAVLAGDKPLATACSILGSPKVLSDYAPEHDVSKWKACSHWRDWWMRENHLSKNILSTCMC